MTTANEKQYRDFTRIINRFFGEAHLVSRPREVFNASLYRVDCQDKKMVFLDEKREHPYHINHAQRENPASPPMPSPVTVITSEQEEAISKARQEQFAYLIFDKLKEEININHGHFSKINEITNYCFHYNIKEKDIMYNFVKYYMLNHHYIYDLSKIPENFTTVKREKILKNLLGQRMQKGKSGDE